MKPTIKYISLLLFGGLIISLFIILRFLEPPAIDIHTVEQQQTLALRQKAGAIHLPFYGKMFIDILTH